MASQLQDHSHPPSSSHRLPTVSASQALQSLRSALPRSISTGVRRLDHLLQGPVASSDDELGSGGLLRGQVTELYGPPGVGKTTIGMQVAANALASEERVVWIDCGANFAHPRFDAILAASKAQKAVSSSAPPALGRRDFAVYTASSLAHLQALILDPPPSFPPPKTALVVVDSISTLLDDAFSRGADGKRSSTENPRSSGRSKYSITHDLSSSLAKLAALKNVAVLLTSHAVTKIRAGKGAILTPSTGSAAWEGGISTRLVLFRDWLSHVALNSMPDQQDPIARFIGVAKLNGLSLSEPPDPGGIIPFTIEESGISELELGASPAIAQLSSSPVRGIKRKYGDEIPDSQAESDEFDWDDFDNLAAEGLIEEAGLTVRPAHAEQEASTAQAGE